MACAQVLAHQLREPHVGAGYSFDDGARRLRATIDAEAQAQTGQRAVIERRMDLKRIVSGGSPLVLTLKGWDGTPQEGKPPVGAGAAEAHALLFGADGLSQVSTRQRTLPFLTPLARGLPDTPCSCRSRCRAWACPRRSSPPSRRS